MTIVNIVKDAKELKLSYTVGRIQNGKWFGNFLRKLNIRLSYEPDFPLLGIYSKEVKAHDYTKTYRWMFIAALFVKALNEK